MSKYINPTKVLHAGNSTVNGISVDRHGNIRKLRVEFDFTPAQNQVVHHDAAFINPIEQAWERQRASV